MNTKRNFIYYYFLTLITILLGLSSRSTLVPLPDFISTYAGDTLWALMVFWILCIVFPYWKIRYIAFTALTISFCIEFSQMYHAQWIDEIRSNEYGRLIFGRGFKTSDLFCYSFGVTIGASIEFFIMSKFKINTDSTELELSEG